MASVLIPAVTTQVSQQGLINTIFSNLLSCLSWWPCNMNYLDTPCVISHPVPIRVSCSFKPADWRFFCFCPYSSIIVPHFLTPQKDTNPYNAQFLPFPTLCQVSSGGLWYLLWSHLLVLRNKRYPRKTTYDTVVLRNKILCTYTLDKFSTTELLAQPTTWVWGVGVARTRYSKKILESIYCSYSWSNKHLHLFSNLRWSLLLKWFRKKKSDFISQICFLSW